MHRPQAKRLCMLSLIMLNIVAGFSRPASAQSPAASGDSIWSASQAPPTQLTLDWLIQEALSRNPEIRAEMRAGDAKRARVPQAGAMPAPTLMFGENKHE